MPIWEFILLCLWVWVCTRPPAKSKAQKNREETLDYLIKRANLYRISQAMEEWGLFYPLGHENKSLIDILLEPEPAEKSKETK